MTTSLNKIHKSWPTVYRSLPRNSDGYGWVIAPWGQLFFRNTDWSIDIATPEENAFEFNKGIWE